MSKLECLAGRLPALPEKLLVGVSGGADSVSLLRLLLLAGKQVTAVHVNHGLRGEASDGDERFVTALCEQLNVPLLTYCAEPPAHPSEDWARRARYAFFAEAMRQTGADALVLAHHRDDQAETLLLHLLRGSGTNGLAGMRSDTVINGMRVLRPLLAFSRQELQDALTEAGQDWREDASNADPRYLRNAIRTQLLPMLEHLSGGAAERIAAAASLLRLDEDALQTQADDLLQHGGPTWFPLPVLHSLPEALQSRVLRTLWNRQSDESLSRPQTDALTALIHGHASQQCNLPGGWHGYRGWQCLHLIPPQPQQPCMDAVPFEEPGASLDGCTLAITPFTGPYGDGKRCQAVPRAWLNGCALRYRQTGDRIRPFGCTGSQPLQDYLVNRRIDAPFRDRIPLLCRGNEVLLCAGVGAGSIPPCNPDDDTILLVWHGDMPWLTDEATSERRT